VKQRCSHFEGYLPPIPESSEQPHRHNRLTSGTSCSRDAGEKKDRAEKLVTIRPDAIENDGNVGEEFGHYIESTCGVILIFDFVT
jgi:hypothetical protein